MTNISSFGKIYRDLRQELHEIRLINLLRGSSAELVRCELRYTFRDNPTPYEALSYTWGERDRLSQIQVDGCQVDVTPNLLSALLRLRSPVNDRLLWVDYICINQQDVQEKNSQVTLMFQIYSKASVVVIWVGEHDESSEIAMSCLNAFEAQHDPVSWLMSRIRYPTDRNILRAVYKLTLREYFRRLWVVQEVSAAVTPMLYCGNSKVSYGTLLKFCKLVKGRVSQEIIQKDVGDKPTLSLGIIQKSLFAEAVRRIIDPQKVNRTSRAHFLDVVTQFYWRESSDPLDKLYALFSILDLPRPLRKQLPIDYTLSASELFIRFARLTIKTTKRLDILGHCYRFDTSLVEPRGKPLVLPSWVPDWTRLYQGRTRGATGMEADVARQDLRPNDRHPSRLFDNLPNTNAGLRDVAHAVFSLDQVTLTIKGVILSSVGSSRTNVFNLEGRNIQRSKYLESVLEYVCESYMLLRRGLVTTLAATDIRQMAEGGLCGLQKWEDGVQDQFLDMFLRNNLGSKGFVRSWLHDWERAITADGRQNMDEDNHVEKEEELRVILSIMGTILDCRFAFWHIQVGADQRLRTLMGLAPASAQEGDSICLVQGCKMPLVLRKMPSGNYVVVGDVFLSSNIYGHTDFENIMDGEVFEKEQSRLQEITLC